MGGPETIMQIAAKDFERIKDAARDRTAVGGATHQFYRYPARFSPRFVRTVIETFAKEGDLVLDPFIGGGTTAVEAMRTKRRFIGTDINELAVFVSNVKTTVLSEDEVRFLRDWIPHFESRLKMSLSDDSKNLSKDESHLRHLGNRETWRHRKIISLALKKISEIGDKKLEDFARCVVLRSAQISLDGRKVILNIPEFRTKILHNFRNMLSDMDGLRLELSDGNLPHTPKILKLNSNSLHDIDLFRDGSFPKLIVTSPPYPGVHVLYHRWQIKGRRETPAPYWIANKLDGSGEEHYTLGNRHEKTLKKYFLNLQKAFSSIASISRENTVLVQMVAFSEPDWQLEQYLSVIEQVGFKEIDVDTYGLRADLSAERIWRDVPNRKWHASRQNRIHSAREIVLLHRLT